MTDSRSKRGLALILGLTPLTPDEKRARRELIRVFVYSDGLLLLFLGLTLSKHWAIVDGSWLAGNFALLIWYAIAIRGAKRKGHPGYAPSQQSRASEELYVRLRRFLPVGIASGIGFIIVGFFNPFGFVCAAFMIISSLGLLIWVRRQS